MLTYHQIIEHAKKYPNKVAVVSNGENYSYGWLDLMSNHAAANLLDKGVNKGELIAVCFSRSVDYIVTILAIHKIGCAFLPINTEQPLSRIDTIIAQSAVKFSVTNIDFLPVNTIKQFSYSELISRSAHCDSSVVFDGADAQSLAYVIFTSGSTGMPKGVKIKHDSLSVLVRNMRDVLGISPDDVLFAQAAFHFDMSIADIYWPLSSGATVFLPTADELRKPKKTIALLESSAVSILQGTPSWYRYLLLAGWAPTKKYKILCGGEAFPAELKNRLLNYSTELWNMYGPTEATVWVSALKITDAKQAISLGAPFPGTTFKIEQDELVIGGDQVAEGYLGANAEQNLKFFRDRTNTLSCYRTGDSVREESGHFIFSGRVDRQIKINGFRVELGEIESVILERDEIENVAVIVAKDHDQALVAFVVSLLSQADLTSVVLEQCEQRLPDYMRVNHVIKINSMPLNSNIKTDYNALTILFKEYQDKTVETTKDKPALIPAEFAEQIKQIWQKRLHLNYVDEAMGFFDLGGNSLIAVQIMADIKKTSAIAVPLDAFLLSSFKEFINEILKQHTENATEERFIVPLAQHQTSGPPLFFVHGVGGGVLNYKLLAEQLGAKAVYGIQARGLDGISEPIADIKHMAALYVKAIKKIQTHGPYYLLGGSMGGVVAFEMACQLQTQGEEVAKLVMFDSYPPGGYQTLDKQTFYERCVIFFTNELNNENKPLRYTASTFLTKITTLCIGKIQSTGIKLFTHLCIAFGFQLPYSLRYLHVQAIHLKALDVYRPSKHFYGDVLYFKATDDSKNSENLETGWLEFIKGNLTVKPVNGAHENLIENDKLACYLREEFV